MRITSPARFSFGITDARCNAIFTGVKVITLLSLFLSTLIYAFCYYLCSPLILNLDFNPYSSSDLPNEALLEKRTDRNSTQSTLCPWTWERESDATAVPFQVKKNVNKCTETCSFRVAPLNSPVDFTYQGSTQKGYGQYSSYSHWFL